MTSGSRPAICDAESARPVGLRRVVGEQPDALDAELVEDRRADAVVAVVDGQAELEVGVDGVEALVLQLVGPQLVGDADPPALVAAQVDDDAAARRRRSARIAACSCGPQSQRRDENTSPVRHSLWTRTSTGSAAAATSPHTSARWVSSSPSDW